MQQFNTSTQMLAFTAMAASTIQQSVTVVRVEPEEFQRVSYLQDYPLIVSAKSSSFFSTNYKYLTTYRELIFYYFSPTALRLPDNAEIVKAKKLNLPS